jgi:predicted DNA-binding transcriptional regulator AlpA
MVRETGIPSPENRRQNSAEKNRAIPRRTGQLQSVPDNFNGSEETMTSAKYDRTLTVRDAAAHLGLSISTLNKLRCTGCGPVYFKLGRAVRYDPHDLDQWLAAHRVGSTSETKLSSRAAKTGV